MKIQRSAILLLLFLSLLVSGQESATNQPTATAKGRGEPDAFQFRGGYMDDFIEVIDKYFGIQLRSFADIPDSMREVRVPPMRVPRPANFALVLNLYNTISSEGRHELGTWIVKGQEVDGKPGAVILSRGEPSKDGRTLNVRVFSCKGIDLSKVESFIKEVETSCRELRFRERNLVEPEKFEGNISYHSETGILLVTGGDLYIKLVEELLQAFKEQGQNSAPKDAKDVKK